MGTLAALPVYTRQMGEVDPDAPDPLQVGKRIRQARKARGHTQGSLAARATFGKRALGNWERGQRVPYKHLPELEQLLGRPSDWILYGPTVADLETLSPAELASLGGKLDELLAEAKESRRLNERVLAALRLAGIEIPLDVAR